ncbi:hypothetical protein CcaCcLH18_08238 [Colletotrichum camelliae]|nr:hypothetical protein CcaCcLH18_08238 [Colletotrichum camelliae]
MKEDLEEDDDDEELKQQLAKANSNIKQMQGMFNESAQAINKLQEAFQQVTQQAAKLESENQTLQAAANIITTPLHGGRQKLKLSAPITYNGTPGTLKGFLIQEEYLKCETLDKYTTETRDIYANFQGFEDALRLLFQDPNEKRQAEQDLSQLQQTKSTKDYSTNFRQLSVQLDLTKETKIFMFYQGLKDEVKDEIIKVDRPDNFLQPHNNWNNTQQSTSYGQHSGPMDLSATTKNDGKKPWNPKCYNCEKMGYIAKDYRQPKKLSWKPVPK